MTTICAAISADKTGLSTAGTIIAALATQAVTIIDQRAELETQLTELARTHPGYDLIESVPGMGPKTSVRFIAETGDISRFPTGGHLASYAGLEPVNRQSGTGLNTVKKDRSGNHQLKNTLFLSAFIATRFDPKAHYQKQRNQRQTPQHSHHRHRPKTMQPTPHQHKPLQTPTNP